MKLNISIIGSGAFGLSAALELSKNKNYNVTVYDKNKKILDGATFANHNRHHYGFHYPRSNKTLEQINYSKDIFEFYFKKACVFNFDNFYAISKTRSNINSLDYENFLVKNSLNYKKVKINNLIFNKNSIDSVFKVKEGIYDFNVLKKIYEERIKNSRIKFNLNYELVSGKIGRKSFLIFKNKNRLKKINTDIVINASYANYNDIISLFAFKKISSEYNLQEFAVISFKKNYRVGVTIMDGNYPSILPVGNTKFHLFAHVKESQLIKEINSKNDLFKNNYIVTNYENLFKESSKYINLLKNCHYHYSILSGRVVKKNKNDTRTSDIIIHSDNFYSLFGAKIITTEYSSLKLANHINSIY